MLFDALLAVAFGPAAAVLAVTLAEYLIARFSRAHKGA